MKGHFSLVRLKVTTAVPAASTTGPLRIPSLTVLLVQATSQPQPTLSCSLGGTRIRSLHGKGAPPSEARVLRSIQFTIKTQLVSHSDKMQGTEADTLTLEALELPITKPSHSLSHRTSRYARIPMSKKLPAPSTGLTLVFMHSKDQTVPTCSFLHLH